MARLRVPSPMRPALNGQAEVPVEGRTLGEALRSFVARYPEVADRLFDRDGGIHPHIMVVVDGIEAEGLFTPLRPDSEIIIIPAISGGASPLVPLRAGRALP